MILVLWFQRFFLNAYSNLIATLSFPQSKPSFLNILLLPSHCVFSHSCACAVFPSEWLQVLFPEGRSPLAFQWRFSPCLHFVSSDYVGLWVLSPPTLCALLPFPSDFGGPLQPWRSLAVGLDGYTLSDFFSLPNKSLFIVAFRSKKCPLGSLFNGSLRRTPLLSGTPGF